MFVRIFIKFFCFIVFRRSKKCGIQLDVTHHCNLHCKTCYFIKDSSSVHQVDVSFDAIRNFFIAQRKEGVYQVWLYGGEPTLRPEIIDLAYKIFPLTTIVTNGMIPISKKYRHMRIFVSLDGLPAEHDYIRGEGVFKTLAKNYIHDKRVVFNVVITKRNFRYVDDIISLVRSLGCSGVGFQLYSISRKKTKWDAILALSHEEKEQALNSLRQYIGHRDVFVTEALLRSWQNIPFRNKECFLNTVMDFYYADLSKKECCTPGICCEHCAILPVHLTEAYERTRDWRTRIMLGAWL